jgi:hypothetical protein
MSDLIDLIRKEVADALHIKLRGLKKSRESIETEMTAVKPVFHVGDDIEFEIILKNNNPFSLTGLDVYVHQMEAVEFEQDPVVGKIHDLASGEEMKVATVRGSIRTNPDDAKFPWRILDYVCRGTVTGEFDLPSVRFRDEECKTTIIEDA